MPLVEALADIQHPLGIHAKALGRIDLQAGEVVGEGAACLRACSSTASHPGGLPWIRSTTLAASARLSTRPSSSCQGRQASDGSHLAVKRSLPWVSRWAITS